MNRKYFEGVAEFTAVLHHPTVFDFLVCHDAIQLINSSVQLHCDDVCDHDIVNWKTIQLNLRVYLSWTSNWFCFDGWPSYQQILRLRWMVKYARAWKIDWKIERKKDRNQTTMDKNREEHQRCFLVRRRDDCVVWNFLSVDEANCDVQSIIGSAEIS